MRVKMKSIDMFCASPASTAICSNADSRAILPQDLRKLIDHQSNRFSKTRKHEAPCSSRLPVLEPLYARKSTSSSSSAKKADKILRRKSSADAADLSSSSRYLLSEKPPFLDFIPESGRPIVSTQLRRDSNLCDVKYKRLNSDRFSGFGSFSTRSSTESPIFKPSLTTASKAASSAKNLDLKLSTSLSVLESSLAPSNHKVVELMVSIHCKGCEAKLRKHISKMEGVTSFMIDLPTKKVTLVGDITPLGVLTSISKVKNAQFWPSPSPQSPRVGVTGSVFR